MYSLERIPCASLVVRVHHAPLSEDGLGVLSLSVVYEASWAKTGVWKPRPLYNHGVYNTSLCPVSDAEKDLFIVRSMKDNLSVREAAEILVAADGINMIIFLIFVGSSSKIIMNFLFPRTQ